MAYQNFFAAKLYTDIGSSDTTITLDTAPTATSGRMVLEARNPTQREIISYTGVSGNQLTGVTRGIGGTTAKPHLKNALIEMNLTAQDLQDLYDAFGSFAASTNDWRSLVPAVVSVTHNGNRSYDVLFASSVASLISPQMRMQFTKTVAGNGYMGGWFNGSSHYFTKTTPSGTLGTVANNFTFEAVIIPTSYAQAYIACRSDAAANNLLGMQLSTSGQLVIAVANGGAANYRVVMAYQSVPLNKKTHVAITWSSGTVLMYFDGVSVPVQTAATGGTAPTTAGTGGDFSIGRQGAFSSNYFPGYISNVAVFDAVLSAATIRQHATYRLTGSEPNCIGAWSLDNTAVNQQAPGTNDLTAQGGVGYTATSPHGQLGDSVQVNKAIGLVMAVNGSTVTVQCPEGITIPTTGGISAVSYASSGVPYGWVADAHRWELSLIHKTQINTGVVAANAITNIGGLNIVVPIGSWRELGFDLAGQITHAGAPWLSQQLALSTSASSIWDAELHAATPSLNITMVEADVRLSRKKPVSVSSATPYYILSLSGVASTTQYLNGISFGTNKVWAIPSGI